MCRSPVFRAMFQHDTAEAQKKEVEMTDVEPDVAERMLDYIYTGNRHDPYNYACPTTAASM